MVTIGRTVSVKVPVGSDVVELICRRPTAAELSKFLGDRFETKGRKVKNHLYEARVALIDKILVDVKGAEYANADGVANPLNCQTVLTDEEKAYWSPIIGVSVTGWKELIPTSWKSSAAMSFEDAQPDEGGEESEGN